MNRRAIFGNAMFLLIIGFFNFSYAQTTDSQTPAPTKGHMDFKTQSDQIVSQALEDDCDERPRILTQPPTPTLPAAAPKLEKQPDTGMIATVDSSGKITSVMISKSTGYRVLDVAAKQWVMKMEFSPGLKEGNPAVCKYPYTVNWNDAGQ